MCAYLHFFAKIRDAEEPLTENEKNVGAEKQLGGEDNAGDANKEDPVNEPEEKEPEDKVNCYCSRCWICWIGLFSSIYIFSNWKPEN